MTEEILQAAILKLKGRVTERFGIIKDLYHRPATAETVDQIVSHAIAMAQLEGAMITLQQYSGALARQTKAEAESNEPEAVTQVEVEEEQPEEDDIDDEPDKVLSQDELYKRSKTFRDSQKHIKGNKSES